MGTKDSQKDKALILKEKLSPLLVRIKREKAHYCEPLKGLAIEILFRQEGLMLN
jgi:hypothetical protein